MFFDGNNNSQQGILGVGPSDLLLPHTDSYLDKRNAKSIAFELCPSDGTMWIDGYDASHMTGSFQYEAFVANGGYYEVSATSGSLGSTDVSFSGNAVLDTGTTLIYSGTGMGSAIADELRNDSGYKAVFGTQDPADQTNCLDPGSYSSSQIDQMLPKLTYKIGNMTLNASATQSYLFGIQGRYCLSVIDTTMFKNTGIDLLLGDAFLRQFVVQFDLQNQQAGFAMEAGCALPEHRPSVQGPFTPPHWYRGGHPE
jgi:hypothetical protein